MIEFLPVAQFGMSFTNFTLLVLIYWRVGKLEKGHEELHTDVSETQLKIVELDTRMEAQS